MHLNLTMGYTTLIQDHEQRLGGHLKKMLQKGHFSAGSSRTCPERRPVYMQKMSRTTARAWKEGKDERNYRRTKEED